MGLITDTFLHLTEKPVQFDHVELEVVNEAVHIEEMAHQSHQAVTYSTQIHFRNNVFTAGSQ